MTTKVSYLRKFCAFALASMLTHFVWAEVTPKLLINIGTTTEVDGWVAHDQTGGGNIPDSGTLSQNDITFQVTKASAGGNHSSAASFGSPVETDFETGSYVDIFDQTHESLVDEIIASLGGSVTLTEDVYKTGVINGGQAGHTGTIAGLDSTKKYVVYIGQGYRKSDHGSCHSFRIENSGYTSIEALDYVVTVRGTGTSVATSYTSFNAATTIQPGDNGLMIVRLKGVVPTNSGTISYTMPSGRSGLNFVAVAEVGGADINEWTGATDGNWSTAGNWTKGVPGADDVVSIPTGATITMTAADQASIMQINGAVTLNGVIDGAKVKATAIAAEATLTVNVAQGVTSSLRNVSGGKIIKTGEGTLRFDNEGGSAINGTTVQIDEGMASVHNSNNDAVTTNPTFIIGENGTLDNKGWFTTYGTLTIESNYDKVIFPNTDGSGGVANNAMIGGSPAIVKKGTGTITLRVGSNGNYGAVAVEGGNLIFGSKQNTTIAGVVSGNGGIGVDGTGLDTVAGTLTLNGNNTYAGGTVITRGQVTLGHDNALGGNNRTVTVNAEGILDVNGHGNHGATATLSGGTLKNGGSNIGDNLLQFRALTLTADSTVDATGNFGVINGGWGATTITFNGHKLIKTGDQEFWLCNITLPEGDTGTIQINVGDCKVVRNKCNLTGVTFTVPADATDKVVENATVLDAAVGTTYQQVDREGGETIYVVATTPTFVLAAGNAATVKEGDTVIFDSHYTGNKWSHTPQLSWANGEKIVVDIEMDLGSSVPANSELVVNHKNFSNANDLKGNYLYGDIGAGATISGTGALFLGYSNNACEIGDGVTISCANVGFQSSGKTATINGTVTIDAEVIMSGSKIKLADGAKLITAKLGDDDVITDVADKHVAFDEATNTYSLEEDVTEVTVTITDLPEHIVIYAIYVNGAQIEPTGNTFTVNVGDFVAINFRPAFGYAGSQMFSRFMVDATTSEIHAPTDESLNIRPAVAVAAIGEQSYTPMYVGYDTLVDAVEKGWYVLLMDDVTVDDTIVIDHSVVIDLQGHNVTGNGVRVFQVKNGTVEIDSTDADSGDVVPATISTIGSIDPDSSVIRIGGGDASAAPELTIDEGVTVSSAVCYGITAFGVGTQTLVVDGTVSTTGNRPAISGNGNASYGETTIIINGTVSSTAENAIYQPQAGTTTINGTVTGGIEAKAGAVTIKTGATVSARETTVTHTANGDGCSTQGYAVAVVDNVGYKGGAVVTIEGGTITGPVAQVVDSEPKAANTLTISGGTFTVDPSAYVADGYEATESEGVWTVSEKTGPTSWETVTDADVTTIVTDLPEGKTVAATELTAWAKANDVAFSADITVPVNALIFYCKPSVVAAEGFDAVEEANKALKALATKEGVDLLALMKEAAENGSVTIDSTVCPLTVFKLVPATLGEGVETSAKLFKLSIELK